MFFIWEMWFLVYTIKIDIVGKASQHVWGENEKREDNPFLFILASCDTKTTPVRLHNISGEQDVHPNCRNARNRYH
jgi:hypothetical protein